MVFVNYTLLLKCKAIILLKLHRNLKHISEMHTESMLRANDGTLIMKTRGIVFGTNQYSFILFILTPKYVALLYKTNKTQIPIESVWQLNERYFALYESKLSSWFIWSLLTHFNMLCIFYPLLSYIYISNTMLKWMSCLHNHGSQLNALDDGFGQDPLKKNT